MQETASFPPSSQDTGIAGQSGQNQSNSPQQINAPSNLPKKLPVGINKIIFIILVILVFTGLGGLIGYRFLSSKEVKPAPTIPVVTDPTATMEYVHNGYVISGSINKFGIEIFRKLNNTQNSQNIVISPLSIATAMSMVYNGSGTNTRQEMKKTLYLDDLDDDTLHDEYKKLLSTVNKSDGDIRLSVANSIWLKEGVVFKNEFMDIGKNYYDALISTLDFTKDEAAMAINDWVSQKTNSKISKIIAPPIDPFMVMYLINAVYFNGTWKYEFDSKLTQVNDFNPTQTSKTKIPFMVQNRKDFAYLENEIFQAVNLPYGEEGQVSMTLFLPKKDTGDFLGKFTYEDFSIWQNQFISKEGTVMIPRFKSEYEDNLNQTLIDLGIREAFQPGKADFSMISDQNDLYISQVKHKTYIDVNEKGTEAAAVTSIGVGITSIGIDEPFYLQFNKPFVFVITDNTSGTLLFTGIINDPQYK